MGLGKIIHKEDRNLDYLKETVRTVYKCLRKTEQYMAIQYDYIDLILPKEIFFITSQELEDLFPDNTPKEREYYITKAKGAVCIMQIGDTLESGEPHDGRAPDYDDWALNADILVYYPVLDIALELSSMGIRVDKTALISQLDKAGCPERKDLPFQKSIMMEHFLIPSAEELVSPVSVCSSFAKLISAKCKVLSGRKKQLQPARNMVFRSYNLFYIIK